MFVSQPARRLAVSMYETDILGWSRQQAELLRRIAAGEAVNEAPDWENIIEEVESVGRSELATVKSLIIQALAHMMKAEAWPGATMPMAHWRLDAEMFREQAADRYAPSMRQNLDMQKLYQQALRFL